MYMYDTDRIIRNFLGLGVRTRAASMSEAGPVYSIIVFGDPLTMTAHHIWPPYCISSFKARKSSHRQLGRPRCPNGVDFAY